MEAQQQKSMADLKSSAQKTEGSAKGQPGKITGGRTRAT
jgi:hypothetical protein